jgi:hypothetical protein
MKTGTYSKKEKKTGFKKEGFQVIRNVLSEEMLSFLSEMLANRAQICKTLLDYNYISPFNNEYGTYKDPQVPNTFGIYSTVETDMLLVKLKSILEKNTGLKLMEQYSYSRVYKNGDELKPHIDRKECEISTTLNLNGDKMWPIFLQKDKKVFKIELSPGDLLIYKGCDFPHWREKFDGQICIQTFLHYKNINSPYYDNEKYDNRPHLGLPTWFNDKG